MFIQTAETPNPNTLKFMPGQELHTESPVNITSQQEAASKSPLAAELFKIKDVAGVLIGQDFIAVTKTEDQKWEHIKPHILNTIMEHIIAGKPCINKSATNNQQSDQQSTTYTEDEESIIAQIKEIIDTQVRPAVAQDGGDVAYIKFEDGIVHLKMKGACSNCPSASVTLKQGIKNLLTYYIPEVIDVEEFIEQDSDNATQNTDSTLENKEQEQPEESVLEKENDTL